MPDVAAALAVCDIELNDVPDMRQEDQKEAIDAPEQLVAPGPCYATHLDVGPAQTRARDTVDAVSRVARAAAELRAVEEQYARGLKKVASTLEGAAGPGKGVRGACAAAAAMLTSASEAHATLATSLAADVEAPLEQSRAAVRRPVRRRRARPSRPPRRQGGGRPLRRAASRLKAHARDATATEAAKPAPGEGSGLDSAADAPPPEKPRASIYARYLAPAKPTPDDARQECDARWSELSLESRKSALEAQRLLTAYQASDEAAVETCVDALRKVGVHQASAFSRATTTSPSSRAPWTPATRWRTCGPLSRSANRSAIASTAPACGTRCSSASRRRRRSDARWEASSCRARPSTTCRPLHLQSRTRRPRP